jgi:hypothetical protein
MSDDRIEPSIDREYTVSFYRKASEESAEMLGVRVVTTREFTSFAYALGLNVTYDAVRRLLRIEIGGLSIPTVMMPAAGGAMAERSVAFPDEGAIDVEIVRKSSRQSARLMITGGRLSVEDGEGSAPFALVRAQGAT